MNWFEIEIIYPWKSHGNQFIPRRIYKFILVCCIFSSLHTSHRRTDERWEIRETLRVVREFINILWLFIIKTTDSLWFEDRMRQGDDDDEKKITSILAGTVKHRDFRSAKKNSGFHFSTAAFHCFRLFVRLSRTNVVWTFSRNHFTMEFEFESHTIRSSWQQGFTSASLKSHQRFRRTFSLSFSLSFSSQRHVFKENLPLPQQQQKSSKRFKKRGKEYKLIDDFKRHRKI